MHSLPSHRYIRLRALQGVPPDLLTEEVLRLGLLHALPPQVVRAEVMLICKGVPPDSPNKKVQEGDRIKHLTLAVDNTKKPRKGGRKRKEASIRHSFLSAEKDENLTRSQYERKYELSSFLTTAGHARFLNALDLWTNPVARELVCGMLSANSEAKTIADMVKKTVGSKTFGHIRPTDVDAFETLFWDFSRLSISEKLTWLAASPYTHLSYTAATEGLQTLLWRLGLNTLNISRAHMLKTTQQIVFSRINQERYLPGTIQTTDLSSLTRTLLSTFEAQEKFGNEGEDLSALLSTSVEARDGQFPPSLNDIIRENEIQQMVGNIEEAVTRGELSEEEGSRLREAALQGEDVEALLGPRIQRRSAAVTSLGLDQTSLVSEDDEQMPYESFIFGKK